MERNMEKRIGTASVVLLAGDLTKQAVDAIVNAANPSLMGGGGVDGAIHSAGGPAILEECREIVAKIGRLDTGKAVMTTGGSLPARRVIHTVGPVWQGGDRGESRLLGSAYRNSLALADEEGLATVAFPSISTGVYGYPVAEAAEVALAAIRDFLAAGSGLQEVRIVLFGEEAVKAWHRAFDTL
jgi:O-acetyl-ADP-ribose deacetylase (regulator of RNase III)